MRRPLPLPLLVLSALAALLLGSCSLATNPDERALEYNSGAFSDTTFDKCIDPGSREYRGPQDRLFPYPSGQRTYKFQGGADTTVDAPAYRVAVEGATRLAPNGTPLPSQSTVEVTQSGTLTFELNISDCKLFQKLHETIGLKSGASRTGFSPEDWSTFLDIYLGGPLERALSRAADTRDWSTLYTSPPAVQEYERTALSLLPTLVEQQAGGIYFTNFKLQLNRPDLPSDLIDALAATETAIQQNKAQQERNIQIASELESIRSLVAVLGPDAYNVYAAIKSGSITVLPIPQGTSVVIPAAPR